MNLHELEHFNRRLDRFFGNYTVNSKPVDLFESDDEYKVIIDLPGIEKDQINIESDSKILEISLENDDSKTDVIEYFIKERSEEVFRRKFRFSNFVDPQKSTVTYENGILTVILPKAEGSKKVSLDIL